MQGGLLRQPVKRLGGSPLHHGTARSCRGHFSTSLQRPGVLIPSQLQWDAAGGAALHAALRGRLWRAAAASEGRSPSLSTSDEEEQSKPGLISNILKPLRDFGIGRTSMVQGGVGLFVFSGIGRSCAQLCGLTDRRGRATKHHSYLLHAGFALMLVAWARGGQLGRRGQVRHVVLVMPVRHGARGPAA